MQRIAATNQKDDIDGDNGELQEARAGAEAFLALRGLEVAAREKTSLTKIELWNSQRAFRKFDVTFFFLVPRQKISQASRCAPKLYIILSYVNDTPRHFASVRAPVDLVERSSHLWEVVAFVCKLSNGRHERGITFLTPAADKNQQTNFRTRERVRS